MIFVQGPKNHLERDECFVWQSPDVSQGPGESLHCARDKVPPILYWREAELYSELRVAQMIFASCLKIIGPFPGNCIAVERNGTERTERNGTPTPERPERNADTLLNPPFFSSGKSWKPGPACQSAGWSCVGLQGRES